MWSAEEGSMIIQNQSAHLTAPATSVSSSSSTSTGIRRDPSVSRFTVARVTAEDGNGHSATTPAVEKLATSVATEQQCKDISQSIKSENTPKSADDSTAPMSLTATIPIDETPVDTPPSSNRSTGIKQVQFTVGPTVNEDGSMNDDSRTASSGTKNEFSFRNIQTVEKVPCIDHYRDLLSVAKGMSSRPTLAELHEGATKESDIPEESNEEVREELHKLAPIADSGNGGLCSAPKKLGWIQGVLIRCILCIIGVMLYLRLSWVAGQAGIGLGIVVVLLATTVTTLTALSLCAIATNGEVKGGGAYFLISRSLGPEFGGSIGVIFSFANAVAAAMYVVGFAESVRDLMKEHGALIVDGSVNDVRIVALCTVVVLLGIVIIGVQFETKAQIVLLGILCISVCSFIIGSFMQPTDKKRAMGITGYSWKTTLSNFYPSWRDEDFFSVFSVYFPAATGIMAGANISGDLMDPQKAIPKGTLLAIAITTVIYILVIIVSGTTCLREASGNMLEYFLTGNVSDCITYGNCTYGLLHSSQILEQESICGPLVIAGVFAATLSSALASMVSAPKVFQALCKDKLFPYIGRFGRGYGRSEEPRQGYLLAFGIAISIILIGDLNAIAPIISNFFLASYALINYACFDASFAKSPGFRPAFKYYNMWLSLFGSLICMAVMFLINWWTALITFALILALYVYLLRRKPVTSVSEVNWGSSSQAHAYRNALNAMLRLAHTEEHVKNYRPQILLLTGNPAARQVLLEFAGNITKETSLLICGHVHVSPHPEKAFPTLQKLHAYVGQWLHKHKVRSFYLPVASESLDIGAEQLIQLAGMGKLRPNIVLLGFKNDWRTCPIDQVVRYVNIIHRAFDCCYGVGVLRLPKGCDMSEQLKAVSDSDDCVLSVDPATDYTSMPRPLSSAIGGGHLSTFMSPQRNGKLFTTASFPNIASDSPIHPSASGCALSNSMDGSRKPCASQEDAQRLLWASFDEQQKLLSTKNPALLAYIEQFRRKVKKPIIDVWWLFDDGGLTLLIPHLLTLHKSYLEGAKLRMFTIASSQHQLEREQRSMAALLSKFRIDYSDVYVIPDIAKKPKNESIKEFNQLIDPLRECNASDEQSKIGLISDADLAAQNEKMFDLLTRKSPSETGNIIHIRI